MESGVRCLICHILIRGLFLIHNCVRDSVRFPEARAQTFLHTKVALRLWLWTVDSGESGQRGGKKRFIEKKTKTKRVVQYPALISVDACLPLHTCT